MLHFYMKIVFFLIYWPGLRTGRLNLSGHGTIFPAGGAGTVLRRATVRVLSGEALIKVYLTQRDMLPLKDGNIIVYSDGVSNEL